MGVTMRDVARYAGVSLSTASRALNQKGDVSDEARERVLAAARHLHYVANLHARALAGASSKTLGLVVSDSAEPFFSKMARGVADTATAHGYSIVICNTDEQSDKEVQAYQTLRGKRVEGVLVGSICAGSSVLRLLMRENIPFVLLNRNLEDLESDYVCSDMRHGAYLATDHLCQLGHRYIAHITLNKQVFSVRERLAGYAQALHDHGIPFAPQFVLSCEFGLDNIHRLIKTDFVNLEPRPTAIFAYNDRFILPILTALHELGLSVPDDIALVGYDDIDYARFLEPPLTTVTNAAYDIGRIGTEILIEKIGQSPGTNWIPRHVILKPELKVRQSSGIPLAVSNR